MKLVAEILADLSAAIAALMWFGAATVKLKERDALTHGLGTGFADNPRALLLMIYKHSRSPNHQVAFGAKQTSSARQFGRLCRE